MSAAAEDASCSATSTARPEPDAYDLITTFDAIHDQGQPMNVLKGIHRALAPGGVYLMQDISGTSHVDRDIEHPLGTLFYTVSRACTA